MISIFLFIDTFLRQKKIKDTKNIEFIQSMFYTYFKNCFTGKKDI